MNSFDQKFAMDWYEKHIAKNKKPIRTTKFNVSVKALGGILLIKEYNLVINLNSLILGNN